MVSWMSDWLKQIVLLVLIATFIDLLLPNNRLDRYVKLVMGLLIILAMLSPVFQLLSEDHDLRSFAFLEFKPGAVQGSFDGRNKTKRGSPQAGTTTMDPARS